MARAPAKPRQGGRTRLRGELRTHQLPLFAPPVPEIVTDPSLWPDFHASEYLGFDTETFDPHLQTRGPGFIRGDAHVIGMSFADESGRSLYLPIDHVEGNVDRDQAIRYSRHQLSRPKQRKVGANLHYDLEAMWSLGVDVPGPLCDVQIAEPLLDEDRVGGYTLEALSQSYLGEGKSETVLRAAAADYGLDPKKEMKYLPGGYAAEYAADDAGKSVFIFMEQEEALKADDVWGLFTDLEQPLQRVLFKMRLHGVRVDLDRAERLAKRARVREEELYREIYRDAGYAINVNSGKQLGPYLEKKGITVPRTLPSDSHPDGQYSVKAEWLDTLEEPAAALIKEYRLTVKMRKDFVEKMFLNENVNGRLHSQWNQLRKTKDEDGTGGETQGTRSGRIAAANVNLTQVPSRHPVWGKDIRSCFLADEGAIFGKKDYSQQEPRGLLHFAYVMGFKGATEVRRKYIDDPLTDYHQATADTIFALTGMRLDRKTQAKPINLGRSYGMGAAKLARQLGVTLEKALEIIKVYDEGVPYVSLLNEACKARVRERGHIVTFLGRKRRFPLWEKRGSFGYGNVPPTDYETAVRLFGRDMVERAGLNKTLNALVQGSAGDQTKRAIVMLDEAGLTPQIQVYDEINGSYGSIADVERATVIMERAVYMTVPMDASPDVGTSWGEVESHKFERPMYYRERTEAESRFVAARAHEGRY